MLFHSILVLFDQFDLKGPVRKNPRSSFFKPPLSGGALVCQRRSENKLQ